MTLGVVPELYVTDLARSLRFYVDALGFEVAYDRPEGKFAAISISGSLVMLEEVTARSTASDDEFEAGEWRTGVLEFPLGRGVSFELMVPDVEAVYERVVHAGYDITLGLRERTYRVGREVIRLRQFLVMDPDGYLMRPAQRIGSEDAADYER